MENAKNHPLTEARSVVTEREMPHPPEKVWRALTQPYLIEEWWMKNDFKPVVDRHFELRFEWGVVMCRVLEVELNKNSFIPGRQARCKAS